MGDYNYQPLPREDCIRLLFLMPGQGSDPIHVHLLSVPLSEAPAFEALSYTWGSPEPSTRIMCGPRGESALIRNNLLDALHHLRDPVDIRKLWVDALSINQANDSEKSKQVKMMGLIYWRSERVIVWLGLDDDDQCPATEVFELIAEVSSYATSQLLKYDGDTYALPAMSLSELSKLDENKWECLVRFFKKCTWFQRGWVIQELGLAPDALFVCGSAQTSLEKYLPFVRWMSMSGQLILDKFQMGIHSQFLATEYYLSTRVPEGTDHLSFPEVLRIASSIQCTDHRDYVYAFLGHPSAFGAFDGDPAPYEDYETNFSAGNGRKLIIEPDYRKSAEEIYTELAKNLMRRDDSLSILSYIARSEMTLQDGCPSWVPRWDHHNRFSILSVLGLSNASLGSPAFFNFEGEKLRLRGIQVDTVLCLFRIWEDFALGFYDTSDRNPERWDENRLEALWKMCRSLLLQLYPGKEPDREAFLYTLTAGTIDGRSVEDDTDAVQFQKNVAAYELEKSAVLDTKISEERLQELKSRSQGGDASRFLIDVVQISQSRVLFLTRNGRFGLGHGVTGIGDQVFVLQGAKVPFILRKCEEKDSYRIAGEAYVHGIMRGEAFAENDVRDIIIR